MTQCAAWEALLSAAASLQGAPFGTDELYLRVRRALEGIGPPPENPAPAFVTGLRRQWQRLLPRLVDTIASRESTLPPRLSAASVSLKLCTHPCGKRAASETFLRSHAMQSRGDDGAAGDEDILDDFDPDDILRLDDSSVEAMKSDVLPSLKENALAYTVLQNWYMGFVCAKLFDVISTKCRGFADHSPLVLAADTDELLVVAHVWCALQQGHVLEVGQWAVRFAVSQRIHAKSSSSSSDTTTIDCDPSRNVLDMRAVLLQCKLMGSPESHPVLQWWIRGCSSYIRRECERAQSEFRRAIETIELVKDGSLPTSPFCPLPPEEKGADSLENRCRRFLKERLRALVWVTFGMSLSANHLSDQALRAFREAAMVIQASAEIESPDCIGDFWPILSDWFPLLCLTAEYRSMGWYGAAWRYLVAALEIAAKEGMEEETPASTEESEFESDQCGLPNPKLIHTHVLAVEASHQLQLAGQDEVAAKWTRRAECLAGAQPA